MPGALPDYRSAVPESLNGKRALQDARRVQYGRTSEARNTQPTDTAAARGKHMRLADTDVRRRRQFEHCEKYCVGYELGS